MRTIGLLGGMSWESSIEYERIINEETRRRLGGTHSADLLIRSYDFADIEQLQQAGEWEAAGRLLARDAAMLERAGAEIIVLCTNTMHRVAEAIAANLTVPFLHIADPTADAVTAAGIERVALLGTRYTMEGNFYRRHLEERDLEVIIPDEPDRSRIHDIIFDELVQGEIREVSRRVYLAVIERLLGDGAEGVIAGCTEIELLIDGDDLPCPLFPTTRLHALAAVEAALEPST